MPNLLALDLSTHVGHARFRARGQVPTFGTLRLEGADLTYKIGQLRVWLHEEYDREPFEALAWERPLLTPKDTVDLLELLYGLASECAGFVGWMRKVELVHLLYAKVTVPEVKFALLGKGVGKKDEILHAARAVFNWPVTTDHEADAGGVGLVAYRRFWPKVVT
jgi:hypothetical protein